jgi:hypothetical protein
MGRPALTQHGVADAIVTQGRKAVLTPDGGVWCQIEQLRRGGAEFRWNLFRERHRDANPDSGRDREFAAASHSETMLHRRNEFRLHIDAQQEGVVWNGVDWSGHEIEGGGAGVCWT